MLDLESQKHTHKYYADLLSEQLKACIHCGMCLPACPTYKVTANEGNSPRGRLYLINDLIQDHHLQEEHKLSSKAIEYLDNCLSCYACETVCPSGVQYGSILEYARNDLEQTAYDKGLFGFMRKIAFALFLPNRQILNALAQIYKRFGRLLPLKVKPRVDYEYQAIQTGTIYRSEEIFFDIKDDDRTIVLPLGCVMDTFYNDVHHDTIYVLNRFGYHVYVPNLGCCGALASHSGEPHIGRSQLNSMLMSLVNYNLPVVMNSAGCGAFVKAHAEGLKIMDLIEALQSAPKDPISKNIFGEEKQDLLTVPSLEITYHPACHLNHRQGVAYDYKDLLQKIPNLVIKDLPDADTCCGSAGIYNLLKPKMAEAIGRLKAENIKSTEVAIVATANPGCMSQIQSALGKDYKVVHPISLIADYLRIKG